MAGSEQGEEYLLYKTEVSGYSVKAIVSINLLHPVNDIITEKPAPIIFMSNIKRLNHVFYRKNKAYSRVT